MIAAAQERDLFPYKMKDLCDASGLERQAIHFYIQQGLLPPGKKTGRNMAWYSDEHLQRLQLIRRLQRERFLPLKAIKTILDGRGGPFSPEQHLFLSQVKTRLAGSLDEAVPTEWIGVDELIARTGVSLEDIEESVAAGSVAHEGAGETLKIASRDAWMFELFGEMRRLGFTRELGFTIGDIAFYEKAMNTLFRQEIGLLSDRLSDLPPEKVAKMIEGALPVVHAFLNRYHSDRVRDFFSSF